MPKRKGQNKYRIENNIIYIELEKRDGTILEAIIDIDCFDLVLNSGLHWHAKFEKDNSQYYAKATKIYYDENGHRYCEPIALQRLIMNFPDGFVDHFNHNTLDNRKKNLRKITPSNNLKHRKQKNNNNTSGYRNVSFINGYYRVQLQVDGKNKLFSEKFEDPLLAGKFASQMRNKYYGDYAGNS